MSVQTLVADLQVAHKSDLCGLDMHLTLRGCADATLEQLSHLVYLKLVYESLTFLARRVLEKSWKGSGVPAQQVLVLLAFAWLVMLMLGSYLPILCWLVLLMLAVYWVALF
eukprot:2938166-Amphidinium_carterae.1